MKFFNLDSPFMQGLSKMADLMWLNILTLICCLPIVTIGASMTAMNYMALKIVRDEECYITKGFFKSFKQNFKQATIIWLIMLVAICVLAGDFYIMKYSEVDFGKPLQIIIIIIAVLFTFMATFVFPCLAKFDNTIRMTVKNAFFMSIMQFPKTILMIILYVIPPVLFVLVPRVIPFVIMFGISGPAWISAKLYDKFFQKLEDQILAAQAENGEAAPGDEDEHIFSDEIDESIQDSTTNN